MKDDEQVIKISSGDDDVTLAFSKATKIKEIEEAAIKELGFEGNSDGFELVYEGSTLQPDERPLVSFHIPDNACLELVATGQGV
jgi:hypothetical protein